MLAGIGVAVWLAFRTRGEEVGRLAVPGTLDVAVAAGDELRFTADSDVLFAGGRNSKPKGCQLQVKLALGARELATASCDLYGADGAASVAGSSTASTDSATGLRRLQTGGQRLRCGARVTEPGKIRLTTSSNLATCVSRSIATELHVFRERASE